MSASISLSGYLPGLEHCNLVDLADDLAQQFLAQLADTGEAHVVFPVIGMLKVESVKRPADSSIKPVVYLKLLGLEAAEGAEDEKGLRDTWRSLREQRVGDEPIPGLVVVQGSDGAQDGAAAQVAATDLFSDTGAHPGTATS